MEVTLEVGRETVLTGYLELGVATLDGHVALALKQCYKGSSAAVCWAVATESPLEGYLYLVRRRSCLVIFGQR
ncbi:unnamed protein product [Sphagnum balticum]